MNKIKIKIISQFLIDFYNDKYIQQRLGQAFVNTFNIKEPIDIFYEIDDKKSVEIIFANYVDY